MSDRAESLERLGKLVTILGALVALGLAVLQHLNNEQARLEQRKEEARKPYLERQLQLYTEAGRSAAIIASSNSEVARRQAEERFWALYWGELAMVEDKAVEGAMAAFGNALQSGATRDQLKMCSLRLAHDIRQSLARSWGADPWRSTYTQRLKCTYPGISAPNGSTRPS